MRESTHQLTTASFTLGRRDAEGMRTFLEQFMPHGVVFSERRRAWWSLRRVFTITGPAAVMEQLRIVALEIEDDLRLDDSYGAPQREKNAARVGGA